MAPLLSWNGPAVGVTATSAPWMRPRFRTVAARGGSLDAAKTGLPRSCAKTSALRARDSPRARPTGASPGFVRPSTRHRERRKANPCARGIDHATHAFCLQNPESDPHAFSADGEEHIEGATGALCRRAVPASRAEEYFCRRTRVCVTRALVDHSSDRGRGMRVTS